jgi:type II secretory pathway pseudopilin PulG
LVELLTVLAVIGVLATLVVTSAGSSRKKASQIVCTSNLRQISLALNMYLDDFDHRPGDLDELIETRYLPGPGTLLCRQDRIGNWGRLASGSLSGVPASWLGTGSGESAGVSNSLAACSYLHTLSWSPEAWARLLRSGSSAGVVACQLHGLGRQDPSWPSVYAFQGLVLRAQRDGAVVRRQVYWRSADRGPGDDSVNELSPNGAIGAGGPEEFVTWPVFSDSDPTGE